MIISNHQTKFKFIILNYLGIQQFDLDILLVFIPYSQSVSFNNYPLLEQFKRSNSQEFWAISSNQNH